MLDGLGSRELSLPQHRIIEKLFAGCCTSLKELLAQRQALQQQVSAARQRETEVVLAEIVRKMHECQISLAELMGEERES